MADHSLKTARSGRSSVSWSLDTPSQLSIRIPTVLSYRNQSQNSKPKKNRRRPPRNLLRHSLAAKLVENKLERCGISPYFWEKPMIPSNLPRIFPSIKADDAASYQSEVPDEVPDDVAGVLADWDRVEEAVRMARKLKDRARKELVNTVGSHSLSSSSLNSNLTADTASDNTFQKQSNKRNVRKKSTVQKPSPSTKDSTNNDEHKKSNTTKNNPDNLQVNMPNLKKVENKMHIPSLYTFPKSDNFIGRDIPRFVAGLKWYISEGKQPLVTESRSHGKRCRVSHPIALGLKREGTSISQQRGQTLGRGDWNVTKVWNRKLDNFVLPVQMAKEDTILPPLCPPNTSSQLN